jgi:hypothetical protein
VQTPRFCGDAASAGTFDFQAGSLRPVRINWVVVAINTFEGGSKSSLPDGKNVKLSAP